ncbi:hypothetical protein [Campylobacter troglodytis]|uniref:hypothetical protein n=1 Tax=Campylobacter troglodytis TaxID=654363 RepID=UPI00163CBB21|nr:hypothetical protein [Campylobacter troglodytis]
MSEFFMDFTSCYASANTFLLRKNRYAPAATNLLTQILAITTHPLNPLCTAGGLAYGSK